MTDKNKPNFSKEIKYWDNYYNQYKAPEKPSSFATHCLPYINKEKILVEFGCGNGRDANFFGANGLNVVAVDRSHATILNNEKKNQPRVRFVEGDFTTITKDVVKGVGTIYSRFTLHSVDRNGYDNALLAAYDILDKEGLFVLEARTINDPLFGIGKPCSNNGYVQDHYRRFLNIKNVISDLESLGFLVVYAVEDYISSWYLDDHAVVLRIFARK